MDTCQLHVRDEGGAASDALLLLSVAAQPKRLPPPLVRVVVPASRRATLVCITRVWQRYDCSMLAHQAVRRDCIKCVTRWWSCMPMLGSGARQLIRFTTRSLVQAQLAVAAGHHHQVPVLRQRRAPPRRGALLQLHRDLGKACGHITTSPCSLSCSPGRRKLAGCA